MQIPDKIQTEEQLDNFLATPYEETIAMIRRLQGDIMILGVGGKMGPTLAQLAFNACKEAKVKKRIIGVSRFSEKGLKEKLEETGIETISCDLLNLEEVKRLPKAQNIIFMAGRKFGTQGSESLTWMMNTVVPDNVAKTFKESNIVVFSTGCVYDLVLPGTGGSKETDIPVPVGEYANSCLGRERIFQYHSETRKTKVLLFRLNYAIDLRYGVLVDIAHNIYENKPVDISVNSVNFIWQGDANNRALLCLEHTSNPPNIINVTGKDIMNVQTLAQEIGKLFGKEVKFTGKDSEKAYLSNTQKSIELFGEPKVSVSTMMCWITEWIKNNGRLLGKPTHFQVTNGQFLN